MNISTYINDSVSKTLCVICGSKKVIVVPKNGLLNNPRVTNIETQLISDFHALCKGHNKQKNETIENMKNTGVRYSAMNIPIYQGYGISYTHGNEIYDVNNPDTMIGTYWYDPIDFMRRINNLVTIRNARRTHLR